MSQRISIVRAGVQMSAANRIVGTVSSTLTAAGTSQTDALLLVSDINEVTSTGASSGVLLQPAVKGDEIFIYNIGGNTLSVYPPVGDSINAVATNGAYTMADAKSCFFTKVSNTRWSTTLTA